MGREADDADGLLILTVANLLTQGDFIRPRESGGARNGWTRGKGCPFPLTKTTLTSQDQPKIPLDSFMDDQSLKVHISFLEERIAKLNEKLTKRENSRIEQDRVQYQIRADELALVYYREALEFEQQLHGDNSSS